VENQLDKSMHRNDSQTSCSFRRLGWKFQKSFQDYKGNRRLILCIDVNTQYYYFNINGNFDFENWEYPFYTIILKTIFKPCWEMNENLKIWKQYKCNKTREVILNVFLKLTSWSHSYKIICINPRLAIMGRKREKKNRNIKNQNFSSI